MTERRIWVWTVVAFLACLGIGSVIICQSEQAGLEQRRAEALITATGCGERVKERLDRSLSATYALSSALHRGNGKIDDFEALAKEMIKLYGGISSMQLSPDGVIAQIVPLEGNEKAVGYHVFNDRATGHEASIARATGKLTLAGPFETIQGGPGVVGRLPVYLSSSKAPDHFWGFATVLIKISELVSSTKMMELASNGYDYELWQKGPHGQNRQTITRSKDLPTEPILYSFDVPNGRWTLSVSPMQGWVPYGTPMLEIGLAILVSALLALSIQTVLRQPLILSREVHARTSDLVQANERLAQEMHDREEAQEALAQSEHQLSTIYESAPMGIATIAPDGCFVKTNQTIRDLLGYSEEELGKIHFADITHPEDKEMSEAAFQMFHTQESDTFQADKRYVRKDGATIWVHVRASAVRDDEGKFLHTITMMSDITDRVSLESRLRQAQKMEAIGTLAGGIAHDFNNILAAIRGNARLVSDELPSDHPSMESIREIDKASQRASELVQQILAFSRSQEVNRKPIGLAPTIADALRMLRAIIPATVEIVSNFESEELTVLASPMEIHQLLMNLGSNAEFAMRGRTGQITVTLTRRFLAESELPAGDYAILTIEDTGRGMAPHVRERAMEPFFTTKELGQGTGLGLSVVHGIVASLGGSISIESERNVGTCVRLYFPLVTQKRTERAGKTETKAQGNGERILFIDDEEPLVFLAERMLGRLNYEVIGYTAPLDAIEAFERAPAHYDLVLCDVSMPRLSGVDVVKKIRKVRPEVPIVLMTGYIRPEQAREAKKAGVDEVVLKPNTVEEIGEIVARVLREHR